MAIFMCNSVNISWEIFKYECDLVFKYQQELVFKYQISSAISI